MSEHTDEGLLAASFHSSHAPWHGLAFQALGVELPSAPDAWAVQQLSLPAGPSRPVRLAWHALDEACWAADLRRTRSLNQSSCLPKRNEYNFDPHPILNVTTEALEALAAKASHVQQAPAMARLTTPIRMRTG